jgi:MFS family permease
LPSLRIDPEFNGSLTLSDESWIGSIVALGAAAAGPVGGLGIEWLGRRGAMLVLAIPFSAAWLLIGFAGSTEVILGGRFLTGWSNFDIRV